MKHSFYLCIILLATTFAAYSSIRYVTPSGSGAMNGTSWPNAYPSASLQIAISASGSGDEVWVAAGTYYTTSTSTRTISFNMKNNVTIYGSFAGTETTIAQRILTSGLTSILSGEIGAVGIADNSYHTIWNTNLNNSAIIDGFIIRDANDNRPSSLTDGLGGGIYNDGNGSGNICSPTIRNCVITNNQAVFGAGIFNNGYSAGNSSPVILNCAIVSNTATTGGGGIDNFGLGGTASPVITNCIIYNNTAVQRAGAMYCWGGNSGNANPTVINTSFVNNTAVDGGAVVSDRLNSGAGSSGNSNPDFKNCIFWGNSVSGLGPQFFILGGATFNTTYTDIDLTGQSTPHTISGVATGTINANPLFKNISSGAGVDGKWLTSDDGLQLLVGSPCINTGNNTGVTTFSDVINNTRIVTTTVDMGAYEFVPEPPPTSILDNNAHEIISFYPNPAKGIIYFSGLENTIGKIKLINSSGAIVHETLLTNHLNVKEFSSGIYFILIETLDKVLVRKLIIKQE